MKKRIIFAAALALASCKPPEHTPPPSPPLTPPTGRYQVAAVSEGERGSTLVLVDTATGLTWYFHQPQGPLFNGFWGDVPRVTSDESTWRQAFQSMMQPVAPATNPPLATPASR